MGEGEKGNEGMRGKWGGIFQICVRGEKGGGHVFRVFLTEKKKKNNWKKIRKHLFPAPPLALALLS